MFEQTFVGPGKTGRDRKIALAVAVQTAAVTGLALVPLISLDHIAAGKRFLLTPAPAPHAERAQPEPKTAAPTVRSSRIRWTTLDTLRPERSIAQLSAPAPLAEAPALEGNTASGGHALAGLGNGLGDLASASISPPPRPASKPKASPVKIASSVSRSQLVFGPKPVYPKLAVMARVKGVVRLQAIISRTGTIENLHVLSGPPLLIPAAMLAVRDWRYRPMLLDGEPVEVITEIDVNFTLRG
jgi:protein TonB